MARSLTSTTLAAAVTATTEQFLTVASATGIEVNDCFVVGDECMSVISISGTTIKVQRGVNGTKPATHASGKKVWHGQPGDFYQAPPSGTADSAVERVLPRVVIGKEATRVFDVQNSEWVEIEREPKYSESDFGTVTQATSVTTGVTVNALGGQITTFAQSAAAAAEVDFTVTNSRVRAGDVVSVCIGTHTSAGSFIASVVAVTNGTFVIRLTNLHAANAGDALLVINFRVHRQGATS